MRAALREGGRFAAQCGGEGNINAFRVAGEEVARREPYAEHLRRLERLWNYAGAEETEARLRAAGFADGALLARALAGRSARARGLRPDRLPRRPRRRAAATSCRDQFVADVLAAQPSPLRLDYVRLNIEATARLSTSPRPCQTRRT